MNPILLYQLGLGNAFTSTWNTENLSTGSSLTKQVKLPLTSAGTYNMRVEWGDGTFNKITVYNDAAVTHTYASAGTYIIKIKGICNGWVFNNTGDRLKIISIQKWGDRFRLGTTSTGHFYGCANLNLSAVSDVLNLSGVTTLATSFRECTALTTINRINEWNTSLITNMNGIFMLSTSFNSDISNWNVSLVTNFAQAFYHTFAFNQNLSNWNVSSVSDMGQMFFNSAFNNGGNPGIITWNTSNVLSTTNMFGGGSCAFNQSISGWNLSKATNLGGMFSGNTVFNNGLASLVSGTMPLTLNTTTPVTMSGMFQSSSAFNQDVGSWNVSQVTSMGRMFYISNFNNGGANTMNAWNTANAVSMNEVFRQCPFNQDVGSWNVTKATSFLGMFQDNFVFNKDISGWIINSTQPVSMTRMFYFAQSFNQNIGAWNTSQVTDMVSMFQHAKVFNNLGSPTINNWSTGNVTDMQFMFANFGGNPMAFNQPIGNWNTSKVTNMTAMFGSNSTVAANAFNQPINTWNTSNVTSMQYMFRSTGAFNQNIGGWNVTKVTNFNNMFENNPSFNNGGSPDINNWVLNSTNNITMDTMFAFCPQFNQPIGNWDVRKVTTFNQFKRGGSTVFNQDLSSWQPISCTNMYQMFHNNSIFNSNLSGWDVSKVVNFQFMFYGANLFNNGGVAGISAWNTGSATNMTSMFTFANKFNQPIGTWDTSKVTTMNDMFNGNSGLMEFNQDIGNWNVSLVTDFSNFMAGKTAATFSTANLDAIYNGWSSRVVKTPITITFGTAKYTAAATVGRAILTGAPNNWAITDGGT